MFKRSGLILFLLSSSACMAQISALGPQGNDDSSVTQSSQQQRMQQQPSIGTARLVDNSSAGTTAGMQREPDSQDNAATQKMDRLPQTNPQQQVPRPVITHSDFEKLVSEEAGTYLPVYGRSLFQAPPSTFAPMDRAPVPSSYVLGPGDELQVRIWGMVDYQGTLTVDRNGQISIPKVGVLNVSGLQSSQLEGFLRSSIGRIYKGFELNATLGRLRSIQIFVLGNAVQPGMYTVGSLSTLVDALFVSGGPSSTGSMRNIQLRRGNQVITEFDLYDLQQRGDRSHDAQLLPGDVIFIPPVHQQVALIGNVNLPGIYELKDKASVSDAIELAGGLTTMAATDLVVLERIEARRNRLVDQFSLEKEGRQRIMQDGDILRIFPVSPRFEKTVTLQGNVATPGRFVWRDGMRISDLIADRNALVSRSHWNYQNRMANDNRAIAVSDSKDISNPVLSMNQAATKSGFAQSNPGQSNPGQVSANTLFDRRNILTDSTTAMTNSPYRDMREFQPDVMSSLAQNSAEINWEYALIERLDAKDLSTVLVPFNLGKAIDAPKSTDDQLLQSGDIVTIFARKDLELPQEKHASYVRVSGEVNAPGIYRIQPQDTLQDLIRRAGGLGEHAFVYGAVLTRESAKKIQQKHLDEAVMQMRHNLAASLSNAQSTLTASTQSSASTSAQMAMQQELIAQMASAQPTGRVVLGMKPASSKLTDLPDFVLEDGDTITIPARLNTVQIVGEVYNASAFRYDPRKSIAQYLKSAGGTTRFADKAHTYLLRADGTTVPLNEGLFSSDPQKKRLAPGDAIVVPMKIRVPNMFWQNFAPIMATVGQTATTGVIVGNYLK